MFPSTYQNKCLKGLKMMTNLECLLFALNQDGGTIHDVSKLVNVPVHELLYGEPERVFTASPHYMGACSVMTNSLKFNLETYFPQNYGDKDFWLGVIDGVHTLEKLDRIRPEIANRAIKAIFKNG